MLAELLVRSGLRLLRDYSPQGQSYWAARYWDRDAAEQQPEIGDHYRSAKAEVAMLIERYARDVDSVLEVACGTGEFTRVLRERSNAKAITALDISARALEIAASRVRDDRVTFVEGDIWKADDLGTFDVVICIDAIHHLGNVQDALARLKTFLRPGGVLIGNLWTLDRYHDLQQRRYGRLRHLGSSVMFLWTALLIRLSGGRLRTGYYRTHLLPGNQVGPVLRSQFDDVLHLERRPQHFVAFACQNG